MAAAATTDSSRSLHKVVFDIPRGQRYHQRQRLDCGPRSRPEPRELAAYPRRATCLFPCFCLCCRRLLLLNRCLGSATFERQVHLLLELHTLGPRSIESGRACVAAALRQDGKKVLQQAEAVTKACCLSMVHASRAFRVRGSVYSRYDIGMALCIHAYQDLGELLSQGLLAAVAVPCLRMTRLGQNYL
jgi:hypothetical protein